MKNRAIPTVLVAVVAYYVYQRLLSTTPGPVVETFSGKVRGTLETSREGRTFYQFLGIPYARPPVGEFRFEDPQPVSKWDGIFQANSFGEECLQIEVLILGRVVGAEDCLKLNVYTPQVGRSHLLPVMVYIHGGLFMGGSSNIYRGKYFVDEDVVLVTMNYRVAALGFLASGDGTLRGNQGLKDQNLAMQWVKANIQNFGGDPDRITLFGESAGGASVHYHMLSPKSRGLFSKAMSMSGTAMRSYAGSQSFQREQLRNYGNKFGCSGEKSKDVVDCLKNVDGYDLVQPYREATASIPKSKYALFAPHLEKNDSDAFLSEDCRKQIMNGKFLRVPWITGVVSREGLLYAARVIRDPAAIKIVNENWMEVLPKFLKYDPSQTHITKKIKDFYFGNVQILDVANDVEIFADMLSDRLFIYPAFEAAKLQSKYSPVYLYYMSYKPQASVYQLIASVTPDGWLPPVVEYMYSKVKQWFLTKILGQEFRTYGPSHGDEMSLLFDVHFLAYVSKQHVDYDFSNLLVKLWVAYAKDDSMFFNGELWTAVNSKESTSMLKYIDLTANETYNVKSAGESLRTRLQFWDSLQLPFS